jgi:hypothetical protein
VRETRGRIMLGLSLAANPVSLNPEEGGAWRRWRKICPDREDFVRRPRGRVLHGRTVLGSADIPSADIPREGLSLIFQTSEFFSASQHIVICHPTIVSLWEIAWNNSAKWAFVSAPRNTGLAVASSASEYVTMPAQLTKLSLVRKGNQRIAFCNHNHS